MQAEQHTGNQLGYQLGAHHQQSKITCEIPSPSRKMQRKFAANIQINRRRLKNPNTTRPLLLAIWTEFVLVSFLLAGIQCSEMLHSTETSFFASRHPKQQQQQQQVVMGSDGKVVEQLLRESRGGELPELTASHNPNDPIQLKAVENFLYRSDELEGVYSVSDLGLMALVTRAQAMVYGDLYTHSYASHADLRRAAGPSVNNELCIKQLENLVNRTERQEVEKYHSKDLNLYKLLDTWGRVPAGLLLGSVFFEGMHDECLRLKVKMPDSQPEADTRYCVLIVKHVDWPQIDKHDLFNLKAGICIPKSCDSSNYKNKYELIMRIARYQYRQLEMDQVKFNGLYCLPDEDSPMRSILHHPKSMLTLTALCVWLAVLLFATWKYQKLTEHLDSTGGDQSGSQSNVDTDKRNRKMSGQTFGLTNMTVGRRSSEISIKSVASLDTSTRDVNEGSAPRESRPSSSSTSTTPTSLKIYRVLSITNNLRLLFDTSKESSLMDTGRQLGAASAKNAPDNAQPPPTGNGSQSQKTGTSETYLEGSSSRPERKRVDLRCIEGIKVVAMVYVIMGHVLMCIPTLTSNAKELVFSGSSAFLLVNLVPAFAVNSFFTITGMLTCYLMFKQHQSYSFITSPGKWIAFILYRYLRIMPMYALAVLYCKHLARFTGSGPLWDYSTSALGQRRTCEEEPWRWTLTFTSNFLPPMEHCIPGGWYLSNDFQFFLATPVFLAALYKRPQLGRYLLYAGILAGYLASFFSLFTSQVDDLRPIASFAPHGFKTYVSHFSFNYTQPQYRIPAYLIGLLVGHTLYLYEQETLNNKSTSTSSSEVHPEAGWSDRFKRFATPVCVLLVALCCVTPAIGARLPFSKQGAKFMVAFITPTYHVLFASAVGLYLLLATTGHGSAQLNRLLALPQWKPLARLSLCAVLVNVETINFIIQGNANQHSVSHQFHVAMNCLCIMATYLVATLVCVLFEAPIRGTLNAILTLAIAKVVAANKKSRAAPQPPTTNGLHKTKTL